MISVEDKTINDILKGSESSFVIPNYQRSYDWGKSELQELLEDLSSVKPGRNNKLFLGSFIFDISEENIIKIVDGQQRLTTISIALIALRNHAKKINEFSVAAEINLFITNSSGIFGNENVKIKVANNILDVYNYISKADWSGDWPASIGRKSVKRQSNKLKPIYNQVTEYVSEFGSEKLKSFTQALLTAYVIVIKVNDEQDVFAVFERVNARGLDLNIGDLLKNYIFSHGIEDHEMKWSEIVENAGGNLPRMLKYFWVSRNGYILQSGLYKELKIWIGQLECPDGYINSMDYFISELLDFSRYYSSTQQLDNQNLLDWLKTAGLEGLALSEDHAARIWRVFKALKLFRITQAYPLLYSVIRRHKHGLVKEKQLLSFMEAIERYHFVNNIVAGRIGNEVEKYYAEQSKEIWSSSVPSQVINEFVNGLRKKKATLKEFVASFADTLEYSSKNLGLISYFFDRLNNYDRDKKEYLKGGQYMDLYTPDKVGVKRNYNIEHILPQSYKNRFDSEAEKEMIDDIGNLLILNRHSNSEFGNKQPGEKKLLMEADSKHYATLRYLTDFLQEYSEAMNEWDLDKINSRTEELAKYSYSQVWNF